MKIIVKNKKPEVKEIFIKNVSVGYVFELDNNCSKPIKALKLRNGEIILLTYSSGDDWFEMGDKISSWNSHSVKILGRVTEIVVRGD